VTGAGAKRNHFAQQNGSKAGAGAADGTAAIYGGNAKPSLKNHRYLKRIAASASCGMRYGLFGVNTLVYNSKDMKNRSFGGKNIVKNPLFKRLVAVLAVLFCMNGVMWGEEFNNPDAGTYDLSLSFSGSDLIIKNNNNKDVIYILPENVTIGTLRIYGTGNCTIKLKGTTQISSLILGDGSRGPASDIRFVTESTATIAINNIDTTTNGWAGAGNSDKKKITFGENISVTCEKWIVNNDVGLSGDSTSVEIENNGNLTITDITANDSSVSTTISGSGNTSIEGTVSGDGADKFTEDVKESVIIPDTSTYENNKWTIDPDKSGIKYLIINQSTDYDVSKVSALEKITINNDSVFNIGANNLDVSKIDPASEGTIKTTGTITVDKTFSAENLILNIETGKLNNINSGKIELTCKAVTASETNIAATGGQKSITTLKQSSFGNVTFRGTSNSCNIDCKEDYSINDLIINLTGANSTLWGGGYRNQNNATVTINGTVSGTGSNLLLYCSANFEGSQSFTSIANVQAVVNNLQNPGSTVTVTFNEDVSFSGSTAINLTEMTAKKNVTFSNTGTTTIGDFQMTGVDGILTVDNDINVAKLALTGAGEGQELTVTGSHSIILPNTLTNKNDGEYLLIDDNVKIGSNKFVTSASKALHTANIDTVIANGWVLTDPKTLTFKWKTDNTNDEWTRAANWDVGIVPVTDATIVIPEVTGKSPVISSAAVGGNISIESGAILTLSGAGDLVLSGNAGASAATTTLSNEGTIVYQSSGRIKNSSGKIINDVTAANNGTVEYNIGSGVISEIDSTLDYYNLKISGGTWSCDAGVKAENLTISGGKISGTFEATNGIDVTGTVTASGAVTFASAVTNTGTLSLGTKGTFSDNVTNTGTINAGTGNLTFSGNYTGTSGSLVGKADVADGVSISFSEDVTFGSFTNNGEKVILSKTGDQSLTTNGKDFAALSFEGSGTKTVTGAVSASTLSLGSGVTVSTSSNITASTELANSGTVSITGGSVVVSAKKYSGTGKIESEGGTVKATGSAVADCGTLASLVLKSGTTSVQGNLTITEVSVETSGTTEANLKIENISGKTNTPVITKLNLNQLKGTVTFNNVVTVTTLTLKGQAADKRLAVSGTGSIILESDQNTAEYLSVGTGVSLISASGAAAGTRTYSDTNATTTSVPTAGTTDADYAAVIRNGWLLKDKKLLSYKWKTDATDSAWATASNWDLGIVPVNDASIVIQAPAAATNKSPVISSAAGGGNLTVQSGATLTFSGAGDLVLSGKAGASAATSTLSNEGTIVYQSSGRVKKGTDVINDIDSGTVEYSGLTTITNTVSYYDLKVSNGLVQATGTIRVEGKFSQTGGEFLCTDNTGSLSITGSFTQSGGTYALPGKLSCSSATISGGNFKSPTATDGTIVTNAFSVTGGTAEINGKLSAGSILIGKKCTAALDSTFITDSISLSADIDGGTAYSLTLYPKTAGKTIYLGADKASEFSLSAAEISKLKGKKIIFGENTTNIDNIAINGTFTSAYPIDLLTKGSITASGDYSVSAESNTITLSAGAGIGSSTRAIKIASTHTGLVDATNSTSGGLYLNLLDTTGVTLGGASATLKASNSNGDINITTGGALTTAAALSSAGNITLTSAGDVTLGANISSTGASGSVNLVTTAGAITKTAGTITASTVTLTSTKGIGASDSVVTTSASTIDLSASTSGNIYVSNDKAASYNGSAATGTIEITNAGTLTVATGSKISTEDNNITLKATGFSFTDTQSVKAGTGIITLTSNTAAGAISLKDSDVNKVSVSGGLVIGDSFHTGTVKLSQDSTPVTIDLPANTTITGGTVTNSANVDTKGKALTVNGNLINDTGKTITGSSAAITINGSLTNNGTIKGGSGNITVTGAYSGTSGSFTASSGNTTFENNVDLSSTAFTANGGTVIFNRATDSNHTLKVKTDKSTTFNNITINSGSYLTCAGEFNITGNWTNNGTFTGTSSTIHFAGTSEVKGSAVTTFDNLTIDSGKTLKTNVTATEGNLIKLSGNWTNNAGTTGFNPNSGTVQFINNSTISGATTFNNFSASDLGGKTLTLNNDVTINGSLTLSGTAAVAGPPEVAASYLTVTDDGNGKGFILPNGSKPAATTGSLLKIGATVKIKTPGTPVSCDGIESNFYKADISEPLAGTGNSDYATVLNNGWRIKDLKDLTYTWTGNAASPASQTDWAARGNWDIGIVPGVTTIGQTQSSGATVIIPDGKTSYPELAAAYSVGSLTIGSSPAATPAAKLTLNGTADLTVSTGAATGTLTNYSQIIYSDSGRIIGYDGKVINNTDKGSVEYNTNTNGTIADVTYYDLKITSGNWTKAGALTVNNNLTISGGSSTFSGEVKVTKNLVISGNSTFNALVTVSGTNGFTVTGTPTLAINAGLTCTNSAISIPTGVTLSLGGTIKSGTNTQSYTPAVTLTANADFQGSTITFGSTIDATTAGTEILKVSGNGVFKGIIGGTKAPKTIEVTGTSTVNKSAINSTDNQTYTKAVTIGEQNTTFSSTSGLVKFSSTLTGTPTVVGGATPSTTYYNLAVTGNGQFDGAVTKFKDFTVTGTAAVNENITAQNETKFNSTCTLATGKTISAVTNTFSNTVTMGTGSTVTAASSNKFASTVNMGNNSKIATTGTVTPMSSFAADISASGNTITLDTPVKITNVISLTAANVTFRNNISGSGKTLTLTANTSFSGAAEITANILNKGTINVPAVADAGTPPAPQTAIAFKGNYTANDSPAGSLVGSSTENPYIDFDKDALFGTFTANSDTVRFMDTTAKAFNPNNQIFADLIFDNGTTTISENIIADNLTININGKVTATDNKSITINKNWTNNATTADFTANESTVIFQSANQSSISGDNKFYNLSCTTSDKVIVFEAGKTQEVSHALTLTGTANQLITLKSSVPHTPTPSQWTIKCTGANTNNSISYVDVQDSNNTSAYRLNATNSKDSGNNDLWNFPGHSYTWTGAATSNSTNWFNKDNWAENSVPGIGALVTIAATTNQPVLEHELEDQTSNTQYASIGSNGTLTVESGAVIDLSTFDITTKSLKNNGRIRLSGAQTITGVTSGSLPTIDNGADSIIEYYGTLRSDKKAALGTSYNKLEFTTGPSGTAGADGEISESITVSKSTLIANSSSKSLTLSGSNIFTGDMTIGSTSPSVAGGTLNITSSDAVNIADGASCTKLTLTVSGKSVKLRGSLTATNEISISAAETTVNGSITAGSGSEIKITSAADKAVTFTGTDTSVNGKNLKIVSGSLVVTKTADSNKSTFDLPVTVAAGLSIKKGKADFNSSLTVTNDITTSAGTETVIKGISNAANLVNAGSFTSESSAPLTLSADLSNTGTFHNKGTVTVGGNLLTSGALTADAQIDVTGNFENSGSATVNALINVTGNLATSGTLTVTAPVNVTGNFINTGTADNAVSNNSTISIKGDFTDTGAKWKEGAGVIEFNGTAYQTFNTNFSTKYNKVTVDKASGDFKVTPGFKAGTVTITEVADCLFDSTLEADSFILTKTSNTQFKGAVTITDFADKAAAGNITFTEGGRITKDVIFNSTGTVTIPTGKTLEISNGAAAPDYADFTHNSGKTVINGKLKCKNAELSETELTDTLKASGTTTISGPLSIKGIIDSTGTLSLSGNTTLAGDSDFKASSISITGGVAEASKLSLTGAYTLTASADISTSGFVEIDTTNITFSPVTKTLTNNGNLYLDSTIITGEISNTASNKLIISDNTTLNGSFTNNGTFEIAAGKTFRLSTNFTNNGTVTANTDSTFELIDNSKNTAVSGTTFAVQNFKADNLGGKTVTLNTDVTVNGTLALSGTAESNFLTVKDDGTGYGFILPNGSQPASIYGPDAGSYLKIGPTVKIKNASGLSDGIEGVFYKASHSEPLAGTENDKYATVLNNGWRIKELSTLIYTWIGGADITATAWENRNYWDIGIVPGIIPDGSSQSHSSIVIIPEGKTSYPCMGDNSYSIKSLTIGTAGSVTHDASLTLNRDKNLIVNDTLSNYSQIIYSSSGRITDISGKVINDSEKGSVEYNTNTNGTISDVEYFDLKITSGKWSKSSDLKINHDLFISGGTNTLSTVAVTNDAAISGGTSTYSGAVSVGKKLEISDGSSTFNGLLTVSGTNGFVVTGTPVLTINSGLTCTSSEINIPGGTLTLGGTINSGSNTQTYHPAVSLSGDTIFNGSWVTFDDAVSGPHNLTVDAVAVLNGENVKTAGKNQIYEKTVSLQKDTTLTGNQVTFDGAVSGTSDLTVDAVAVLNGENVTTTGKNQLYKKAVELQKNTTLKGNQVEFDGAVNGVYSLTVEADVILNGSTVTTTGKDQHYNQTVELQKDTILTGNHVTFDGAVSGDYDLTVSADAVLNGETVTTTGKNQVYEKTVTLQKDTTLTGSQVEFDGAVSGPWKLTVSAAAVLNGETVTTTGKNQVYEKTVTLQKDTTLTGSQVEFDGAVNGAYNLTIESDAILNGSTVTTTDHNQIYKQTVELQKDTTLTGSQVEFDGAVNGGYNLTIEADAILNGSTVTTTDHNQIYKQTVELQKNTTLTGSQVEFAGAVNGGYNLTVEADAILNGSTVTTTGFNQVYKQTVELKKDTVLTGNQVEFDGAVNGPWNLTVDAVAILNGETVITADKNQVYEKTVTLQKDTMLEGKQVTFNGAVSGPWNLTVEAVAILNCESVTTTGKNQLYKKAVELQKDTTLTGTQVEFDDAVSGPWDLTVSADSVLNGETVKTEGKNQHYKQKVELQKDTILTGSQVTFDGVVSGPHDLTVVADAVLNGETVTTTDHNQIYKKTVELQKDTTLTGNQVEFDGAVNGAYNLKVEADAVLNGETVTTADKNQVYKKTVELQKDTVLAGNQVAFDGAVSGPWDLTVEATAILNGETVTTTGKNQIYKQTVELLKDTTLTGKQVTFECTLNGDKTLLINGKAVFDGKVGDATALTSLEVTGTSDINGGSVTTAETQEYKDNVTLGNDAEFYGTKVNFDKTVTGVEKVITLNSDKAIIKGNVSVKDFISNAELEIKSAENVTVQASGIIELNKTYDLDKVILKSEGKTSLNETGSAGAVTVTNTGLFELALDKTLTVSESFVQNGNGKNDIKGNIKTTGNGTLSFAQNVYINGKPSAALTLGGEDGNVSITENLIIAFDDASNELTIDSPLTAKNVVLYSGKLSVNKDIKSEEDMVLLGSGYKDNNNHPGEYLYTKKRNVPYNYHGLDSESPEVLPDGRAFPANNGELFVKGGISLTVGKNFYANGLSLGGDDVWFLEAGANSDSTKCFIEAYNCVISNSTVRYFDLDNGTRTEKPDVTTGMAENCTDGGSNKNWDFEDFIITDVETVKDSVIKITFNKPVRNLNNELSDLVTKIHYNSGTLDYSEVFKQYEFNNGSWNITSIGENEPNTIYLLTSDETWNTDATGISAGDVNSTDSHDNPKTIIPNLTFDRDVKSSDSPFGIVFTDRFGKILKQSGALYDKVSDGASPVLVKVITGQENHTRYDNAVGPDSQPSYDAHNFIEFVYSEPVDFDNTPVSGTLNLTASQNKFENEAVETSLGAITQTGDRLTVAGLATFPGTLKAGDKRTGKDSSLVHGLYRTTAMTPHTIRLSVAGLVDGEIEDNDGNKYKNWIGYIDNAVTPSGNVSLPLENGAYLACPVYDLADQDSENPHVVRNQIQEIKNGGLTVTGNWDTIKPSFAVYRKDGGEWNSSLSDTEAIGSTVDGTSSLKRIEFHLFDNKPAYDSSDSAFWVSRKGWVSSTAEKAGLKTSETYAADDFGGSRMFDDLDRSSGGIRYSSLYDAIPSFRYTEGDDLRKTPELEFNSSVKAFFNVTSPVFLATEGKTRTPNYADSPYFGLQLESSIASVKTAFVVSYNGESGFITDLAGNRLESAKIKTIDTTPPSFVMSVAPVGQKKLYLMFAKRLNFDTKINLFDLDSDESINKDMLGYFAESFDLGTITGTSFEESDLKIDSSVAPVVYLGKKNDDDPESVNTDYCSVEVALNREVTYEDVRNLYVRCKPLGPKFRDPVTGLETYVASYIQDDTPLGNYLPAYSAHALSDFAVNLVNPVYAYNQSFNAPDDAAKSGLVQKNLFGEGSYGVHDWDAEQKNFGTLLPEDEIHVIASTVSKDAMSAKIYLDNSPESGTVSDEYNRITGMNLRIWLPEIPGLEVFNTISFKANSVDSYFVTDGKEIENADVDNGMDFTVPKEAVQLWSSGDQVSFLFGMTESDGTNTRICHSPVFNYETNEYSVLKDAPLFALRLKDSSDILSLDLWSFRLKEMTLQKGRVTILNNVIDAGKGEKTVVRVDNPKAGRVDVIVMTLDGNVIEYLHRGELEAGNENYFTWNGRNRAGKAVARGMYFIRVIGNGFDETRKVTVVK